MHQFRAWVDEAIALKQLDVAATMEATVLSIAAAMSKDNRPRFDKRIRELTGRG